ncbi:17027_t:CDS:2 [Gigaspora margarita]|uniref:17027_t:CDS:1 n=1 Tax=Gigaspora margarita TaxID=4874 RepID=A0ABN7UDK3_GIGMA|nr:17027_t:CDS:2 [Gigaspora margarita]
MGDKSVYDLDTLDPWQLKYNRHTGLYQNIDTSQVLAGQYYEDNLKKSLDKKWQDRFNMKPEFDNPDVEAVRQKYLGLYEINAKLFCSQVLANYFEDDNQQKSIIRKWDMCKVNDFNQRNNRSKEFGNMFNELYKIAFLEKWPKMKEYLQGDHKHWAKVYYEYHDDEDTLIKWQKRMKDLDDRYANPTVEIKNIVSKLELLDPSSDYAGRIQKILFEDDKNIENVLNELYINGSDEFKSLMKELESHYGSISKAAKAIVKVYTSYPKNKDIKIADEKVKDDLKAKLSVLSDKSTKVLSVLTYGFALVTFVKSIVGDDINVAKSIEFGKATLTFISDLSTKILAKCLTNFFLSKSELSISSTLRKFSLTLAQWFDKGVVKNNVTLGIKLFGRNVVKFAERIAVLTAIIGFGLSCYDMANAIKKGDRTEIIFASLTATISLAGVIVTLGFMAGASWAGPVGWIVAVVGAVVAITQLLLELFGPKEIPPHPLQEFHDQVMVAEGYVNVPLNYYYAITEGKLCRIRDDDFSEHIYESFKNKYPIELGGILKYNEWIYVFSQYNTFKFKENDPEKTYVMLGSPIFSCKSCVLYGNFVYAVGGDHNGSLVYKWDIRNEDYQPITEIKSKAYIKNVEFIVRDKQTSIYVIDRNSIYKHDTSTNSEFDKWIDVVTLGNSDFERGVFDFKCYNNTFYAVLGYSLYTIDIETKDITRIFDQYDWYMSSFILRESIDPRKLFLVSGFGDKLKNKRKSVVSTLTTYNTYHGPSEIIGYDSYNQHMYKFYGHELKNSGQFFIPGFISVIDQETGEKSQEINPEANNWNREFSKGERIASRVYKILVESSTIYHKGKPAIIKNVMIAARHSLILVQRLGWQVIYDSKTIDPPRLRVMTKDEFAELIKKIEEQEPVDNNDYYKLSDENLKELEDSF